MDGLNLTTEQALALLALALPLLVYLVWGMNWQTEVIAIEEEEAPQPPQLSPNYGLVIWLEGRRWN